MVVIRHHPNCTVWVSMQEYSAVNLTIFAKLLAEPSVPEWLTGVRCFSSAWLAADGF